METVTFCKVSVSLKHVQKKKFEKIQRIPGTYIGEYTWDLSVMMPKNLQFKHFYLQTLNPKKAYRFKGYILLING